MADGTGAANEHDGLAYEIAADLNVVRVIAEGRPTPRDFLECTERLLDDPAWQPGRNLLIDYRKLRTFAFKTDGIREISRVFRERAGELGGGKCAVVTPNLLIYGLFRMWYPWLPDELQWTVRSFNDIDGARGWLGLEVDPDRSHALRWLGPEVESDRPGIGE